MSHLSRFTSAAAFLLAFAGANPALAQNVNELNKFESVDLDGSGCIDWEELRNAGAQFFHAMDLNADGMVAADELFPAETAGGEKVEIPPISPVAFQVQLRTSFVAADADTNNCLSSAEYGEF